MTEEFKKIDDYDNYSVSNLGNVRNDGTGRIRKGCKDGGGYLIVGLHKNGIQKMFYIHRLIGIAFLENCNDCKEIDHINRNNTDNRVENLRWATRSQQVANRGKFKNKSSTFIGVSFDKTNNKWLSQIRINNKNKNLGRFNTELEAFECRQKYIIEYNLQEFYN
jgi:hypothetical protein